MEFHVGPFVWRVRMHRGIIIYEGEPLYGLCDYEKHRILVSDRVPEDARFAVIMHEVYHAWRHHFPSPISSEEQASDYFGALALSLVRDLLDELPGHVVNPPLMALD